MEKHALLITRISMATAVAGSLFAVAVLDTSSSATTRLEAEVLRGHYRFREADTSAERSIHNPLEWTKRRYTRVPGAETDRIYYRKRFTQRGEDRPVPTAEKWDRRTPKQTWTSTTPRGRVPVADSDYNERLLRNVRDARGFRHVPQSERELAQTPAQIRRIRYLRERHAARQRRHSAAGEVTAGKENLDAHAAEVRAAIERLEENRTQQIQERRSTRRAERALQIIEERFSKKIERQ